MKEKDLSTYVEGLLDLYGWRWTHFRPAMERSGKWLTALSGHKGFPDYVAVRDGRLIFAELKSNKGVLTNEQKAWLQMLNYATMNGETYIWRPSDMNKIKEVLE